MDLNEHTKIQCFNCHQNIILPCKENQPVEPLGTVCEDCLNRQSNEITAMNTLNEMQRKMLKAFQNKFENQLQTYRGRVGSQQQQREQQLERELKQLQQQSEWLEKAEKQQKRKLYALIEQYNSVEQAVASQSEALQSQQILLQRYIGKEVELSSALSELQQRNEHLERTSVLCELYSIHFDDKMAYVNKEAVTFKTSKFILQILCQLMDRYQYQGFKVNFCENHIKTKESNLPLSTESQESTIPWLAFIAKESVLIWEHMKEKTTLSSNQSYEAYTLPFSICLQPKLSISGVELAAGPTYPSFLKYFSHNVKFMVNFDFNAELKGRSGSRQS